MKLVLSFEKGTLLFLISLMLVIGIISFVNASPFDFITGHSIEDITGQVANPFEPIQISETNVGGWHNYICNQTETPGELVCISYENISKGLWDSNQDNITFNRGFVGIGTNDPQVMLQVGDYRIDSDGKFVVFGGYASDNPQAVMIEPDKINFYNTELEGETKIYSQTPLYISAGSGTVNQLTLISGGNVGIGTSTPETKLDVNGDITANKINVGTGDISGGNIFGSTLNINGVITGTSLNVGTGAITGGSLNVGTGAITGGAISGWAITGSSLDVGDGDISAKGVKTKEIFIYDSDGNELARWIGSLLIGTTSSKASEKLKVAGGIVSTTELVAADLKISANLWGESTTSLDTLSSCPTDGTQGTNDCCSVLDDSGSGDYITKCPKGMYVAGVKIVEKNEGTTSVNTKLDDLYAYCCKL